MHCGISSSERIEAYRREAERVLNTLGFALIGLATKLAMNISACQGWFVPRELSDFRSTIPVGNFEIPSIILDGAFVQAAASLHDLGPCRPTQCHG